MDVQTLSDAARKKERKKKEKKKKKKKKKERKKELVNGCFEPSQPLGIISGLKETFIKRYKVERTSKAEIRPEEQSQKTENCRKN